MATINKITLPDGSSYDIKDNTSGYITDAGVTSFNGSTGAVTYTAPVTSVNGQTGAVTVDIPKGASTFYGVSTTAPTVTDGTVTYSVTCSAFTYNGPSTIPDGTMLSVRMSSSASYSTDVNTYQLTINNITASINNSYSIDSGYYLWTSGETVSFVWSSSNRHWKIIRPRDATSQVYGLTKLTSSVTSTATNIAATPNAVKQVNDKVENRVYYSINESSDHYNVTSSSVFDYHPSGDDPTLGLNIQSESADGTDTVDYSLQWTPDTLRLWDNDTNSQIWQINPPHTVKIGLKDCTAISSNQNLNSYVTTGSYYCSKDATAATLSNCPISSSFRLYVIANTGAENYRRQLLFTYNEAQIWERRTTDYGSTWNNWVLYENANYTGGLNGALAANLNSLTTPGIYFVSTSHTNGPESCPAIVEVVARTDGTEWVYQRWHDVRLALADRYPTCYERTKSSGSWSSWKQMGGTIVSATLSANKSLASSGVANVVSISLPPGTWSIVGAINFQQGSGKGYRIAYLASSATGSDYAGVELPALSAGNTRIQVSDIRQFTSTSTVYLNAQQNGGSALTINASTTWLKAVRIG